MNFKELSLLFGLLLYSGLLVGESQMMVSANYKNVYPEEDLDQIAKLKQDYIEGNITLGVISSAKVELCIMAKVADAIAVEMGVIIILQPIPAKRLPSFLERGIIHGDFNRTSGFLITAPFALKVRTPIAIIPYYAYGLNPESKRVTDWNSLRQYKIVLPRGYAVQRGYLKEHTVHLVDSVKAAFGFIRAGRADITVTNIITASLLIKDNNPIFNEIKKIGLALEYM